MICGMTDCKHWNNFDPDCVGCTRGTNPKSKSYLLSPMYEPKIEPTRGPVDLHKLALATDYGEAYLAGYTAGKTEGRRAGIEEALAVCVIGERYAFSCSVPVRALLEAKT